MVAHMCNLALRRLKEVSLGFIMSNSPAKAPQQEPVSNQKIQTHSRKTGKAMAWNITCAITPKNLLKFQGY